MNLDSSREKAFELAPMGMAVISIDGRFRSVNQALCELVGVSADDLVGTSFLEFMNPAEFTLADFEVFCRFVTGDLEKFKRKIVFLTEDGEEKGLNLHIKLAFNSHGRPDFFIVQFQEMEESHLLAQNIDRDEPFLKKVLETSYDGYFDWDISNDRQYLSPRFWQIFGFDGEDDGGRPNKWQKLVLEDDLELAQKVFEKHVESRGREGFSVEVRGICCDKSVVWVRFQGQVTDWDHLAKPARMVGTVSDITELKLAQQALANSMKLAALGEMAGGISHEINNPLAIIRAIIDSLLVVLRKGEGVDEAELKSKLVKVCDTIARISRIIDGLRLYSRESEQVTKRSVRLNKIVRDTLALCSEKLKKRGIQLEVDIEDDVFISANKAQISQVILNLITNSSEAIADSEERWIRIQSESSEKSVELRIVDSGPGIDKSISDKIMMPLFSTKADGKGTGLGLSVSKGILESHGGALEYCSDFVNTTFLLKFPKLATEREFEVGM